MLTSAGALPAGDAQALYNWMTHLPAGKHERGIHRRAACEQARVRQGRRAELKLILASLAAIILGALNANRPRQ